MSELFRDMEAEGRARGVTEYSISQTTLEQVFLRLAKKQIDSDEEEVGGGAGIDDSASPTIDQGVL